MAQKYIKNFEALGDKPQQRTTAKINHFTTPTSSCSSPSNTMDVDSLQVSNDDGGYGGETNSFPEGSPPKIEKTNLSSHLGTTGNDEMPKHQSWLSFQKETHVTSPNIEPNMENMMSMLQKYKY